MRPRFPCRRLSGGGTSRTPRSRPQHPPPPSPLLCSPAEYNGVSGSPVTIAFHEVPAMRDTALFTRLLALQNPWRVEHVALDPQQHQIDLCLTHRRNATFTCPECGTRSPLYDHLPYRKWRHLDHGDCLTWLHARPPRVACPQHGI